MLSFLKKRIPGQSRRPFRSLWLWGLGLACLGLVLVNHLSPVQAQSSDSVENREDAVIQQYSLPKPSPRPPVVQPRSQPAPSQPAPQPRAGSPQAPPATTNPSLPEPSPSPAPAPAASSNSGGNATAPLSQYVLQFNRSPVVGNALQMQGILAQSRLGFTRPRHWQVASAKVQLRFRHSPALYADRSNLTVQLNNIHLGSVPLNRGADEIGNVLFDVPPDAIQDYNTIVMQVQQHTSKDCTDPSDPTLWTEILPDSQVIINYRPQAIAMDLANYPYPFLNDLDLDADRLTYLRPETADDTWMTAASRFQASAARLTNFRPIQTRLISQLNQLQAGERLVIIGTPATQPLLAQLDLPFALKDNKFLDGGNNTLPNTVGLVMLTTTRDRSNPVLVITGNDHQGVLKAAQALVQPSDRQLLTGQAALISEVADVPSPGPRDWPGYLPPDIRRLQLADLEMDNHKLFEDVTVNGLPVPPPIEIPLKTLPDDQFLRGSTFTLRYSYGPNVDAARSSVSIRINDQALGGERLRNADGATDSITVTIPPELMTPTSKLSIQFFTYPRMALNCGDIPDQPMWGTVHGNSSFNLNRTSVVQLPNLKLLQAGFPITAPQDLSQTTFVLPARPSDADILTMLQASSRFGRLSQAPSVKLGAYSVASLPETVRQASNLIGIGDRDRFPLPELFEGATGFSLGDQFVRRQNNSQVQTLPDEAGVIEAAVSPWNSERILLGLTGQTEQGLKNVQAVFARDDLFSQLEGDTLLIQETATTPDPITNEGFKVTTLSQNPTQTIDHRGLLNRVVALLQANWYLIPGGILLMALVFYGVSQLYLNRFSHSGGA